MCEEDDIPLTKEQIEQIIAIMKLPTMKERLEAIGCELEEIETAHGTICRIKNKYLDDTH